MGVNGLWPVLSNASRVESLKRVALEHLLQGGTKLSDRQPYCIGVDISLWLHQIQEIFSHKEHAGAGYHPHLRTIFYRLLAYYQLPVQLIFVQDGPDRPDRKREKVVRKPAHFLVEQTKKFVECLGFVWHEAPAEAEAELARMNVLGIVDAVLTDDGDAWVFGAKVVIRNPQKVGRKNKEMDTNMYTMLNVSRTFFGPMSEYHARNLSESLVVFALMTGSDYDKHGLDQCGAKTAQNVVTQYPGLSESIAALFRTRRNPNDPDVTETLSQWREALAMYVSSDPLRRLDRKRPSLASRIPATYPKPEVVNLLTHPRVTEDEAVLRRLRDPPVVASQAHPSHFALFQDTNIGRLRDLCAFFFQWSIVGINKVFKANKFYEAVALRRILNEAALLSSLNVKIRDPGDGSSLKCIAGRAHVAVKVSCALSPPRYPLSQWKIRSDVHADHTDDIPPLDVQKVQVWIPMVAISQVEQQFLDTLCISTDSHLVTTRGLPDFLLEPHTGDQDSDSDSSQSDSDNGGYAIPPPRQEARAATRQSVHKAQPRHALSSGAGPSQGNTSMHSDAGPRVNVRWMSISSDDDDVLDLTADSDDELQPHGHRLPQHVTGLAPALDEDRSGFTALGSQCSSSDQGKVVLGTTKEDVMHGQHLSVREGKRRAEPENEVASSSKTVKTRAAAKKAKVQDTGHSSSNNSHRTPAAGDMGGSGQREREVIDLTHL